jgi:hypothetical protein
VKHSFGRIKAEGKGRVLRMHRILLLPESSLHDAVKRMCYLDVPLRGRQYAARVVHPRQPEPLSTMPVAEKEDLQRRTICSGGPNTGLAKLPSARCEEPLPASEKSPFVIRSPLIAKATPRRIDAAAACARPQTTARRTPSRVALHSPSFFLSMHGAAPPAAARPGLRGA